MISMTFAAADDDDDDDAEAAEAAEAADHDEHHGGDGPVACFSAGPWP